MSLKPAPQQRPAQRRRRRLRSALRRSSGAFVRPGDAREDRVAILEGLKPGERIVTEGQIKLQPNARVRDRSRTPAQGPQDPRPPRIGAKLNGFLHRHFHPPAGSGHAWSACSSCSSACRPLSKLQIRQYPGTVVDDDHHHHHLSRRQCRPDQGLHHDAARTGGGEHRGHRHAGRRHRSRTSRPSPSTCSSTPTRTAPSTDVLSKVNQVKSVLPREAQDPIVVKQTGQGYALMYMSFNSKVLTACADHRLSHPRRAAAPADDRRRRQRADPRRPDLRDAHLARPEPDGGARHHAARCARRAGGEQLHLRRRPDQGRLLADEHQRADVARQAPRRSRSSWSRRAATR